MRQGVKGTRATQGAGEGVTRASHSHFSSAQSKARRKPSRSEARSLSCPPFLGWALSRL